MTFVNVIKLAVLVEILFSLFLGTTYAKEGLSSASSESQSTFSTIDRNLNNNKRRFSVSLSYNAASGTHEKASYSGKVVQEVATDDNFEHIQLKYTETKFDQTYEKKSLADIHFGVNKFFVYYFLLRGKFEDHTSYSRAYSDSKVFGFGISKVILDDNINKLHGIVTYGRHFDQRPSGAEEEFESGNISFNYNRHLSSKIRFKMDLALAESFSTNDDFWDLKASLHMPISKNFSSDLTYGLKHRSETFGGHFSEIERSLNLDSPILSDYFS